MIGIKSDAVWKDAVVKYFREFLLFFFPEIEKDIDFDMSYEFLDKELQKISSHSEVGKRHADILVKVFLKDGTEEWLLIHIEVQGYAAQDFSKRMFTYNYRILDRYNANVVSLAVLADDNPHFRQDTYEYRRWGFHHLFHFPVVKILDYRGKEQELEGERNPFGVIVLAHLREMETKRDVEKRLLWKVSLVKALYDKGYTREDVLLLYTFIDWLISLPRGYDRRFHEEIVRFEEVKKVPFVTTAEKIGMEKGLREGIERGLKKGIKEGMKEGMKTGKLELVRQLLIRKFGSIDKEMETLLSNAPVSKIDELALAIFDIKNLQDAKKLLAG